MKAMLALRFMVVAGGASWLGKEVCGSGAGFGMTRDGTARDLSA